MFYGGTLKRHRDPGEHISVNVTVTGCSLMSAEIFILGNDQYDPNVLWNVTGNILLTILIFV